MGRGGQPLPMNHCSLGFSPSGSQTPDQRFYENTGVKTDFNVFVKADYTISENWSVFGDLQFRRVDYEVEGIDEGPVSVDFEDLNNFFNPKFGLSYFRDNSQFYFSYARGNKEPKRADYLANPEVRPETLDDFELVGYRYHPAIHYAFSV